MTAVPGLVAHLFRHQAGRLVALLTRPLGPCHLQLAEDVVQEALLAALHTWPTRGVPDNPPAWLLQVARRRAIDVLRRDRTFADHEPLASAGRYRLDSHHRIHGGRHAVDANRGAV